MIAALKFLLDNSNFWIISMLVFIGYLFSFELKIYWFLIWHAILDCILAFLGIKWWDSGFCWNLLFYQARDLLRFRKHDLDSFCRLGSQCPLSFQTFALLFWSTLLVCSWGCSYHSSVLRAFAVLISFTRGLLGGMLVVLCSDIRNPFTQLPAFLSFISLPPLSSWERMQNLLFADGPSVQGRDCRQCPFHGLHSAWWGGKRDAAFVYIRAKQDRLLAGVERGLGLSCSYGRVGLVGRIPPRSIHSTRGRGGWGNRPPVIDECSVAVLGLALFLVPATPGEKGRHALSLVMFARSGGHVVITLLAWDLTTSLYTGLWQPSFFFLHLCGSGL